MDKDFNHDPEKFTEFSERYTKELDENPAAIKARNDWPSHPIVTLLYSESSMVVWLAAHS